MSWLLLLLVGLALVYLVRLRTRLALLAEQIRALRAHALEPVSYTSAPAGALDARLNRITAEVELLGFRVLGDYVEHSPLLPAPREMRWIVDAPGTTFGWLAPFDIDGERHILAVLMSHELDQQTITSRQPPASTLSRPPFVDLLALPTTTSMHEVYARHKMRAALDDRERAFVPVHSFAEVEHEVARMRDKVTAWRRSAPADELLDADLKTLLGPQYHKLAQPLRRRLA